MEIVRTVMVASATVALSAGAVLVFARLAPGLRLLDVPGGRKEHSRAIPLVGGLSIFVALLAVACVTGMAPSVAHFLIALSTVIAIGLWDDVVEISPRVRFAIQIVASSIMIWGAGIELRSVGDLLGLHSIGLGIFAIPMTIFAIVGVVNAVNMMDGMDGLAGSVAFTAYTWYAIVAADSGLRTQFEVALLLCSALAGFLVFNLRLPWQPQAKVFLGDAGSLMLGFALGWFAIDLTQGEGRTFPPICALWVLLLPLADCVSVMSRRIASGRSPFSADRRHIHHYLLARGFSHSQTLALLVGASAIFGAVGYFGWRLHVREAALFYPFFFGFFAYHFWLGRAWKTLERNAGGAAAQAPKLPREPRESAAAS